MTTIETQNEVVDIDGGVRIGLQVRVSAELLRESNLSARSLAQVMAHDIERQLVAKIEEFRDAPA